MKTTKASLANYLQIVIKKNLNKYICEKNYEWDVAYIIFDTLSKATWFVKYHPNYKIRKTT